MEGGRASTRKILLWRIWNKFFIGFTCREVRKGGFQQKQKCNLGSSALFTGINNYVLAELPQ